MRVHRRQIGQPLSATPCRSAAPQIACLLGKPSPFSLPCPLVFPPLLSFLSFFFFTQPDTRMFDYPRIGANNRAFRRLPLSGDRYYCGRARPRVDPTPVTGCHLVRWYRFDHLAPAEYVR